VALLGWNDSESTKEHADGFAADEIWLHALHSSSHGQPMASSSHPSHILAVMMMDNNFRSEICPYSVGEQVDRGLQLYKCCSGGGGGGCCGAIFLWWRAG